jgi:hypothetical protein
MQPKSLARLIAGLTIALCGTKVAFAETAGSFIPYQPSESSYIYHGAFDVFNNDNTNYHYAIAPINAATNTLGGTITDHVHLVGNGLLQTCQIWAVNLTTGASYTGTGSTSATGVTSYPVSITLPTISSPGYMLNMFCYMPPYSGGYSQIYGFGAL